MAQDIRRMEEQIDDLYKMNVFFLRRYKDDLIKEFNIQPPENLPEQFQGLLALFPSAKPDGEAFKKTYITSALVNRIKDIMKEEMPEPWYCYGFVPNV